MRWYDIQGNMKPEVYNISGIKVDNTFSVAEMEQQEQQELVIMSFNVYGWAGLNDNQTLMADIFEAYSPDIVGFQEYYADRHSGNGIGGTRPSEFLGRYWEYLVEGIDALNASNEPYVGNTKAVASRFKLKDATDTVFTSRRSQTRSYQKMYIEVGGKRIAIFNTHLEWYQTNPTVASNKQYGQAAELFEAVSKENYFILIGDLNTKCMDVNHDDYTYIMKPFVEAGYNCSNCSKQSGFIPTCTDGNGKDNEPWYPTDNIITSANISIDRVVLDKRKMEYETTFLDHLPLITYVTIR